MGLHLSFHYPNKDHPNFGAFLRIPGLDKRSYTLELDEDILSVNYLLSKIESFGRLYEAEYIRTPDDSEVMLLPDSMLNGFSGSGRRNYMDISSILEWDWKVVRADELSELITRSMPTVAGMSLEKENTAIVYDAEEGIFELSIDEWIQSFDFRLFGDSFNSSLSDAFDEIRSRHPDVLEKATPTEFINEVTKMFEKAGAKRK